MKEETEKPKKMTLSEKLLIPRHQTQEFMLKEPGSGVVGVPKNAGTLEQTADAFEPVETRRQHELMGISYIAFALLLFVGLGWEQGAEESQLKSVLQGFVRLNGAGPALIGFFALYCGIRRLGGRKVFESERQILMFPVLYFSFLGSLASFGSPNTSEGPGGIMGNYIYWYLQPIMGTLGAQIVLISGFLISLMNVADVYISDAIRYLKETATWVLSKLWILTKKTHHLLVVIMSDLIVIAEKGLSSFKTHVFEPVIRRTLHGDLILTDSKPKTQSTPVLEAEVVFPFDEEPFFPEVSAFIVREPQIEKPVKAPAVESVSISDESEVEDVISSDDETIYLDPITRPSTLKTLDEPITTVKPKSRWEETLSLAEEDESLRELTQLTQAMMVDTEEFDACITTEDQEEFLSREFRRLEPVHEEWEHPAPPSHEFLARPPKDLQGDSEDELWERGARLIKALDTYKVNVALESFTQGPTITRFELKPAAGTKLSRIQGLTNEMAMSLAAKSVRIEAPIPGTNKVGVEIPNANPLPVYFSEIITNITGEGREDLHPLTVAFGKNIAGEPVIGNLAKMPHLLVAGSTGSGKSVCVNTIISSILFRARPDQVKFVMIDPKQVELAVYRNIPHLITDVVTNPEEASAALKWGVDEMERRYSLLSHFGVRHIDNFNIKVKEKTLVPIEEVDEIPTETLPYVVLIVDELADLMMVAKKDVETSICRIAQKARAVGMHLVIATQRPSVDVITGLIKANLPSRVAFMVKSAIDSRTILDQIGAENLLGRGDMLYYPGGQPRPERVQGAFMNDEEVAELVHQIKDIYGEAQYQDIVSAYLQSEEPEVEDDESFYDDKFNMALEIAVREGYVSTSMLQRHLGIGYNRAARIVDVMFARGLCGQQESGKKRKVLLSLAELEQNMM
ncbi:MAG: DNA translocase FtsK 4TM domain-containing protein [Candidatus Cloacimonetes bacterium]|nr:DNA translocase FtsK 4TM domain-containing protein [Candidatus Cloacimonadota bacterium]